MKPLLLFYFMVLFFNTVQSEQLFTAKDLQPKADSIAMKYLSSKCLVDVISNRVDSTGKSPYWIFMHDSLIIYVSSDSVSVEPRDIHLIVGWGKIKDGWINSDAAVKIAEENGGQSFRKKYPDAKISAHLLGDSAFPDPLWDITYSSEILKQKIFQITLNAMDGTIIRQSRVNNRMMNNQRSFSLLQNYPNPFNATTTICFHMSKPSYVFLAIYNLSGQLLEVLIDDWEQAGEYQINWQAANYPSGIYLCRLKTCDQESVKKFILQK